MIALRGAINDVRVDRCDDAELFSSNHYREHGFQYTRLSSFFRA